MTTFLIESLINTHVKNFNTEIDLHGLSYGAAFCFLDYLIRNDYLPEKVKIITGWGKHYKDGNLFRMKDLAKDWLKENGCQVVSEERGAFTILLGQRKTVEKKPDQKEVKAEESLKNSLLVNKKRRRPRRRRKVSKAPSTNISSRVTRKINPKVQKAQTQEEKNSLRSRVSKRCGALINCFEFFTKCLRNKK